MRDAVGGTFMIKLILVFLAVLVSFNKLTGRGVDFSFLLNVLILPLVVSYIFSYSSLIDKGKVQNIILDFFIIECFLAIIEKVLNFNLFPLVSNGSISDWTWEGFRSTAFQSHPLSNALIVSRLVMVMSLIFIDNPPPICVLANLSRLGSNLLR